MSNHNINNTECNMGHGAQSHEEGHYINIDEPLNHDKLVKHINKLKIYARDVYQRQGRIYDEIINYLKGMKEEIAEIDELYRALEQTIEAVNILRKTYYKPGIRTIKRIPAVNTGKYLNSLISNINQYLQQAGSDDIAFADDITDANDKQSVISEVVNKQVDNLDEDVDRGLLQNDKNVLNSCDRTHVASKDEYTGSNHDQRVYFDEIITEIYPNIRSSLDDIRAQLDNVQNELKKYVHIYQVEMCAINSEFNPEYLLGELLKVKNDLPEDVHRFIDKLIDVCGKTYNHDISWLTESSGEFELTFTLPAYVYFWDKNGFSRADILILILHVQKYISETIKNMGVRIICPDKGEKYDKMYHSSNESEDIVWINTDESLHQCIHSVTQIGFYKTQGQDEDKDADKVIRKAKVRRYVYDPGQQSTGNI